MTGARQQIWEAFCRDPGEEAFGPLYEETRRLVYTICRRMLHDPDDAADAFQSAYGRLVAVARDPRSHERDGDIDRLVSRLARREAGNLRDRNRRRAKKEVAMEDLPTAAAPDAPGRDAEAREMRHHVETLVRLLPDRYHLPLLLHYLDGLSRAEIARALDLPPRTVSDRVARGTKRLRRLLLRAGLGKESLATLSALACAQSLEPPSSLAAAVVFAKAQALATVGAGGTAGLLGKTVAGGLLMKTKAIVITALLVAIAGSLITIQTLRTRVDGDTAGDSGAARTVVEVAKMQPTPTPAPTATPLPRPAPAVGPAAEPPTRAVATSPDSPPARKPGALAVRVVWRHNKEGVSGAVLALKGKAGEARSRAAPTTVATLAGDAVVEFPPSWVEAVLTTTHPNAAKVEQRVELKTAEVVILVELDGGGDLFGTVRMAETHEPVAGAEVRVLGTDRAARSLESGAYSISGVPGGLARVVAARGSIRSFLDEADVETIAVEVGGRVKRDLTVSLRPFLIGVVRDMATGSAVTSAVVTAQQGMGWGTKRYQTTTDLDGGYQLATVPAQSEPTKVTAAAPGYVDGKTNVRFEGMEDVRCDLHLEPGGAVDVLVKDEEGAPVEGAKVSMTHRNLGVGRKMLTDADGRARIEGASTKTPPAVSVGKEGYRGGGRQTPQFRHDRTAPELVFVLKQQEAPPGKKGYFAGQVTDREKKPLKNIRVLCSYHRESGGTGSAKAATDDDGRYRLAVVDSNQVFWLRAAGEGWSPAWENRGPGRRGPRPGTEEEPTEVNFVLEPAHWIEGTVVDTQGSPVGGVAVTARTAERVYRPHEDLPGKTGRATTGKEGRFRLVDLPPNSVHLSLWKKGMTSFEKDLKVDRKHSIVMLPTGVIRGRVVDEETDEPVPNFVVKITVPRRTYVENTGQSFADGNGRFLMAHVAGDSPLNSGEKYTVTVRVPGFPPTVKKRVKALPPDQAKEIVFRVDAGESVRGRIVDGKTGEPLPDVAVVYGFLDGGGGSLDWERFGRDSRLLRDSQQTSTRADGSFTFIETDEKGALFVKTAGYRPVMVSPRGRKKLTVDGVVRIALEGSGAVMGVYSRSGRARAKVKIDLTVHSALQGYQPFASTQTDEAGWFLFDSPPAGSYALLAADGPDELGRSASVAEGENKKVELGGDLGPLVLEGRVLDENGSPLPNVYVEAKPSFQWDYLYLRTRSDDKGIYRIEGLRPGRYGVTAARGTRGWGLVRARDVDIQADLTLDLAPEMGTVVLRVDGQPSAEAVRSASPYLLARSGAGGRILLEIGTEPTEHKCPAGSYDAIVFIPGYRSDPPTTLVEVRSGETSTLEVAVQPDGMVFAMVMGTGPLGPGPITPTRLTLDGAGTQRVLVPDQDAPAEDLQRYLFGTHEDRAMEGAFLFRGLPEGEYQLTIEADGHETWTGTRAVVPGHPALDREDKLITLEPSE